MERMIHNQVTIKDKVHSKCRVCGKPRTRTIKIEQRQCSDNRNENGVMKTKAEIRKEVNQEFRDRRKKMAKRFICKTCELKEAVGE